MNKTGFWLAASMLLASGCSYLNPLGRGDPGLRQAITAELQLLLSALSLLLSVVGLVAVLVTFRETRRSTLAAREQADIAEETLRRLKDAERPYLVLAISYELPVVKFMEFYWNALTMGHDSPGAPLAEISFVNFGTVPARIDAIHVQMDFGEEPPTLVIESRRLSMVRGGGVVGPGQTSSTHRVWANINPIAPPDENALRTGRLRLWLFGKVVYRGMPVTGRTYETEFLYRVEDNFGQGGLIRYLERGGEARNNTT